MLFGLFNCYALCVTVCQSNNMRVLASDIIKYVRLEWNLVIYVLPKKFDVKYDQKWKKGPKLKVDFFFKVKYLSKVFFSCNKEGLNFLKKILSISGSALQLLKTNPKMVHFCVFFWSSKSLWQVQNEMKTY